MRDRFAQCYVGDVLISAITLPELEYGVEVSPNKTRNAKALADLLDDLVIAPFDGYAAKPMDLFGRRRGKVNVMRWIN